MFGLFSWLAAILVPMRISWCLVGKNAFNRQLKNVEIED
jgi:hypothetical protein